MPASRLRLLWLDRLVHVQVPRRHHGSERFPQLPRPPQMSGHSVLRDVRTTPMSPTDTVYGHGNIVADVTRTDRSCRACRPTGRQAARCSPLLVPHGPTVSHCPSAGGLHLAPHGQRHCPRVVATRSTFATGWPKSGLFVYLKRARLSFCPHLPQLLHFTFYIYHQHHHNTIHNGRAFQA